MISGVLMTTVGREFAPDDDPWLLPGPREDARSALPWPYQDRYQMMVEQMLGEIPEIRSYFSIIALSSRGPGQVNAGFMFVRLVDRDKRRRTTQQVVTQLRGQAKQVVGADVFFFINNPLRQGTRGKPLQFVIQNPEFDQLADYSQRLAEAGLRD